MGDASERGVTPDAGEPRARGDTGPGEAQADGAGAGRARADQASAGQARAGGAPAGQVSAGQAGAGRAPAGQARTDEAPAPAMPGGAARPDAGQDLGRGVGFALAGVALGFLLGLLVGQRAAREEAREVTAATVPALARTVETGPPALAVQASQALGELGARGAAAVPALVARLEANARDPGRDPVEVRLEVLFALERMGPAARDALPALDAVAVLAEPGVSEAALDAIAAIEGRPAEPR